MIDNEIMKNLECYSRRNEDLSCKDCSNNKIYKIGQICFQNLMGDAFELVSRQKAEIERLKDMVSKNEGVLPEYENFIKSEAVKDFTEKLKETITNAIDTYYTANGGGYYLAEDTIEDIDNLVREMAEAENDNRKTHTGKVTGNDELRTHKEASQRNDN